MKFSGNADNAPMKSSLNFGDFPNSRGTLTCHHISSMFCNLVLLFIIETILGMYTCLLRFHLITT